jgi:hypothetical protein
MIVYLGQVWIRDTNGNFYQYGGTNNQTYENCGVEFTTPYLNAETPGTQKRFTAMDVALEGTWAIGFSSDYIANTYTNVLNESQSSFQAGTHLVMRYATHFSLNGLESGNGYARFSSALIYYTQALEKSQP